MFRHTIAILLLLAIPLAAVAQTPSSLTLAAAVARARSESFEVRLSQADEAAATARVLAARAQLLPQLGISGTVTNGGVAQLGMPVAQQTYLLANASVPLFDPSDAASVRAARAGASASGFDALRARNDAGYLAAEAYERALLARAVVASRIVTVNYQQRRVSDITVRIRVGSVPRYEGSQAQAALAGAMQTLEDANADRDEAIDDLEVILDMPIAASLALSNALEPLPLAGNLADFQRRAAEKRPSVLAAQQRLLAADAQLASTLDRYLPNVVGAAQSYAGRSNPDLGARGYQLGITATLPVYEGGARKAASLQARTDVERARVALDQARRSAERDVANAWYEYAAARRNLDLAHTQARATGIELRITMLRERTGKGIALETLAALNDDATARENVLRATARLNDAVIGLHRAAGDSSPINP
ncbi:MAG TPA: TolC family protein [Candidatus Dormibacteraeota bacterium]|nr:TolC family protein [Candidatus Dormibacteraeota bacterium]